MFFYVINSSMPTVGSTSTSYAHFIVDPFKLFTCHLIYHSHVLVTNVAGKAQHYRL